MSLHYDYLIIGGGIVGLTAALALEQRGYQLAILDAAAFTVETDPLDARVYAINQASWQLFASLGLWELLDPKCYCPYQGMMVWDAENQANIEFDAKSIGQKQLGIMIQETQLKQALLQAVTAKKISCFANEAACAIHFEHGVAKVESKLQSYSADMLILVDGANSKSRELLGIGLTSWPYQQKALVCSVETEFAHQNKAYQVFLETGPLAFLPLPEKNRCSIVWSTRPKLADHLAALPEEVFNTELEKAFARKLGTTKRLAPPKSFPLMMRQAREYAGKNWLLMGDAAHSIHPLAGLGLNLGLADLSCWLRLLDESREAAYTGNLQKRYQTERQAAVWKTIMAMEGIKRLFSSPLPILNQLRAFGLNTVNKLDWLKRFFISEASGL